MILKFSEKTKKALSRSGWSENRRVNLDIDPMFVRLTSEFTLFDIAKEFLADFYQISVTPNAEETPTGKTGTQVHFDPNTAIGESDRLDDWENVAKEKLFPIGDFMYFFILISESGKIYLGETEMIHFVAANVQDGLEKLISFQSEINLVYPALGSTVKI
jgi:hypothetical protein